MAAEAQRRQEERIAKQEADVAKVEAGQRMVRTGGRGMLAFIDDKTGTTFGGSSAATRSTATSSAVSSLMNGR